MVSSGIRTIWRQTGNMGTRYYTTLLSHIKLKYPKVEFEFIQLALLYIA